MTDRHTVPRESSLTYCGGWLDRAGDRLLLHSWLEESD
jgi:hypothetical protein